MWSHVQLLTLADQTFTQVSPSELHEFLPMAAQRLNSPLAALRDSLVLYPALVEAVSAT